MVKVPLRPYQKNLLARWATLPLPRRLFLCWDMGAGKTLAALSLAEAFNYKRILIICPAVVRTQWVRECERHLPERSVSPVKNGTHYPASDVVVTSYDLLAHVAELKYDFVIIDEFHALRSVNSKQSKAVRQVFTAQPHADAVALSGTPIPNEAKQLWNPVDTLFPHRWGKQTRKGLEPFYFVNRYCNQEVNEFGRKYTGLREDRKDELATRFAEISDRVVQADFAHFLPPLYVQPLEVKHDEDRVTTALSWLENLGHQGHIGIYGSYRQLVRDVYRKVPGSLYVDGTTLPSDRFAKLHYHRNHDNSITIATIGALNEGISLSHQKAALILEWTSDVASVVQFLGRFARQDSTDMTPTRVDIAIGPNDISAAQTICERVKNINSVIRSSRSTDIAVQAFTVAEMSDDAFSEQLNSLAVSYATRSKLWAAGDDDDDDGDS